MRSKLMLQRGNRRLLVLRSMKSLQYSQRYYNVIKLGNDVQQKCLFDTLGYSKDTKAQRMRRSKEELQQGFVLQVIKSEKQTLSSLSSITSTYSSASRQQSKLQQCKKQQKKKQAKIDQLKKAYTLLHNDRFRANYCAHFNPSNDAQLHVLCDGGQMASIYNPQHQNFIFVDHSKPAQALSSPTLSNKSDVQYSLNDFSEAYQNATGEQRDDKINSNNNSISNKLHHVSERRTPLHGSDIPFTLQLSFDESLHGCTKVVRYKKWNKCTCCNGEGYCANMYANKRPCPQCCGRGSIILPSATYHIERKCTYCLGEGHTPPPACNKCKGHGVSQVWVQLPIQLPAGLQTLSTFHISKAGNDGCRGGKTGNLVLSLCISQHRHFHRCGNDLHAMLPLSLSTALLGGLVTVSTLHGPVQLHIPPCIRNGHLLRITGAGIYSNVEFNGNGSEQKRGDMIYHALIMIPFGDKLTGHQKTALGMYELCSAKNDSSSSNNKDNNSNDVQEDVSEGETMFEQCARLKEQYSHWFINTL